MLSKTMQLYRDLGGVIARLAPAPDGGAEVLAWNSRAWRPAAFAAGDVLAAPVASDARLAEFGIRDPLSPWRRQLLEEFTDPEIAEDRALERMFARRRARRRQAPANDA